MGQVANKATYISPAIWRATVGKIPASEYKFLSDRRFRFDYAFIEDKIAIEIEGGIWSKGRHVRGIGYIGDMDKYNLAVEHGWLVLRYQPNMIDFDQIKRVIQSQQTIAAHIIAGEKF